MARKYHVLIPGATANAASVPLVSVETACGLGVEPDPNVRYAVFSPWAVPMTTNGNGNVKVSDVQWQVDLRDVLRHELVGLETVCARCKAALARDPE